jgi:hypothetical protein
MTRSSMQYHVYLFLAATLCFAFFAVGLQALFSIIILLFVALNANLAALLFVNRSTIFRRDDSSSGSLLPSDSDEHGKAGQLLFSLPIVFFAAMCTGIISYGMLTGDSSNILYFSAILAACIVSSYVGTIDCLKSITNQSLAWAWVHVCILSPLVGPFVWWSCKRRIVGK